MNLTFSSRGQSAFRRVLLADHDAVALVSDDIADALTQLVPCDVLMTGEGDAQGYVLRGVDFPEDLFPDEGPRVCEGPWNTGFEHLADMSHDDFETATSPWVRGSRHPSARVRHESNTASPSFSDGDSSPNTTSLC